MDSQIVTVDQFAEAMASIQEAIASLGRRIDGQQAQQVPPWMVPNRGCSASRHRAYPTSEDPHARMDRLEQGLRQLRTSDRAITWEHRDEGSWTGRASDDYSFPTIFEWGGPALVCISGASRRRTWDDLAQEFLRQFSFNTVVDVSRRELEALRQRAEESVSSFISRWRGKIAEISIDHQRGPDSDGFEEPAAADRQTCDSSPSDVKGKKPFVGQRRQMLALSVHPATSTFPAFDQTYQAQPLALPYYATQGIERPPVSYTATGQPCYAAQDSFTDRHAVEPGSSEAIEAGLLTALAPRPPPQPFPSVQDGFTLCIPSGAWTRDDRCTALRHAIQDLIDQGLVHLGQPSVTTNPLPAHTTHAVPPPAMAFIS
ncbi:hypothetical protein CK203_023499 [Vitis vinifera]|uniref:Retrotransposon gag domain-containing protein n=1 Tax=Vitis vinifera TaxID=29760 RepID=A0A438J6V2_VITVI|nr:hypothetical protein CK203_023499 [Vitis vinifera]